MSDISTPALRGTALVTGAAGFIGSHLVRELLKHRELKLVCIDDLSGGYRSNIPDNVVFHEASVTDAAFLAHIFDEWHFDYVYHLAAYAAEGLSHFIRQFNYQNNVIGSINLINECVKHQSKSFVFTSSIAVYGAGQVPMTEAMTPRPEDPYGIAKYAVEMDLAAAQRMFGLNYVVFRPHNVYGEFQNIADRYRNVVGIFMNQILSGEPLTIFGDGEQQRAFSYVGDIVGPMAAAPAIERARNRIFNIGADTPYTVNELAAAVCSAMGVPRHPIRHLEARNEVMVAYSDHAAARDVFDVRKGTSLPDGLEKMVNWVKTVGARRSPAFGKIEIARGLPAVWLEKAH